MVWIYDSGVACLTVQPTAIQMLRQELLEARGPAERLRCLLRLLHRLRRVR